MHWTFNFDAKRDNKQENICAVVYWSIVCIPNWKMIRMIEVECMVEGETVKKAVILACFSFLCMHWYIASLGAMTASNLCSKFQAPVLEMVNLKEINASSTIWRPFFRELVVSCSLSTCQNLLYLQGHWHGLPSLTPQDEHWELLGCQCPPNLGNVLLKHGLVQECFLLCPPGWGLLRIH